MAPSNGRRIMTIQDLNGESSEPPNSREEDATTAEPSYPLPPPPSAMMDPYYCQPIKTGNNNNNSNTSRGSGNSSSNCKIPIHPLNALPMADVCRQTLERILTEFSPIIQRRGYRIKSISEFCCCGDGLDEIPGNRKRRKQGDTIWGYNQSTTWVRKGPTTNVRTSIHTIHLRLRKPKFHTTQLLPWEFVAGTMAHELSHCIHQNHSPAFYKLMEEILDEHAMLQSESFGKNTNLWGNPSMGGTGSVPSTFGSAYNDNTLVVPNSSFPSSSGQRLGGDPTATSSRLLQTNNPPGKKVGGSLKRSVIPLTAEARREAMAQAAERRQRQMEQIRRMIEQSKEPCVIEIFDDDDDDIQDGIDDQNHAVHRVKSDVRKRPSQEVVDLTSMELPLRRTKMGETIDLTESPAAAQTVFATLSTSDEEGWNCHRCTVLNRPLALSCEVCLEEQKEIPSTDTKNSKIYGTVIELD